MVKLSDLQDRKSIAGVLTAIISVAKFATHGCIITTNTPIQNPVHLGSPVHVAAIENRV
jgi:hypothetical protein